MKNIWTDMNPAILRANTYTAYASIAKSRCLTEFSPSTSVGFLWKDSISAMLIFVWKRKRKTKIREMNESCVIDSGGRLYQPDFELKIIPEFRQNMEMFT